MYVVSCINEAIEDESRWPLIEEHVTIGMHILKFQGYIIFINGTFINIHKSWNNDIHKSWFNRHKKIYYMNNMVVLNYHKLFTLLVPSMTWTSCVNQIYTKIGIEFFYIEMSILNIYWMTLVIWVKTCLWCDGLRSVNLPLVVT